MRKAWASQLLLQQMEWHHALQALHFLSCVDPQKVGSAIRELGWPTCQMSGVDNSILHCRQTAHSLHRTLVPAVKETHMPWRMYGNQ